MKVVLDTNVILSAYLFGGRPLDVLKLAKEGVVELLTSDEALGELVGVLHRDKFSNRLRRLGLTPELVVSTFKEIAVPVAPANVSGICGDPDDDHFIGIAIAGEADAIISGDKHLLNCAGKLPVRVVTVSEFLAMLGQLTQQQTEDGA